jgi:hypothetical protein
LLRHPQLLQSQADSRSEYLRPEEAANFCRCPQNPQLPPYLVLQDGQPGILHFLIDKFDAEILENGNIKFNSAEDQMTFSKEHADLMQYEIEELEALELNFDDLGDAELTPRDLMTLEGVINFVE